MKWFSFGAALCAFAVVLSLLAFTGAQTALTEVGQVCVPDQYDETTDAGHNALIMLAYGGGFSGSNAPVSLAANPDCAPGTHAVALEAVWMWGEVKDNVGSHTDVPANHYLFTALEDVVWDQLSGRQLHLVQQE